MTSLIGRTCRGNVDSADTGSVKIPTLSLLGLRAEYVRDVRDQFFLLVGRSAFLSRWRLGPRQGKSASRNAGGTRTNIYAKSVRRNGERRRSKGEKNSSPLEKYQKQESRVCGSPDTGVVIRTVIRGDLCVCAHQPTTHANQTTTHEGSNYDDHTKRATHTSPT